MVRARALLGCCGVLAFFSACEWEAILPFDGPRVVCATSLDCAPRFFCDAALGECAALVDAGTVFDAGPPPDWHAPEFGQRVPLVLPNEGLTAALVDQHIGWTFQVPHPAIVQLEAGRAIVLDDDGGRLSFELEGSGRQRQLWVLIKEVPPRGETPRFFIYFNGEPEFLDAGLTPLWQDHLAVWHLDLDDGRAFDSARRFNFLDLDLDPAEGKAENAGDHLGLRLDGAAHFSGGRDQVLNLPASGVRTYALWAELGELAVDAGPITVEPTLFSKVHQTPSGDCFGPSISYLIDRNTILGRYRFGACDDQDPRRVDVLADLDVTLMQQPRFIAFEVDSEQRIARLYVDDLAPPRAESTVLPDAGFRDPAVDEAGLVRLGALELPGGQVGHFFFGELDELRILPRAYAPEERALRFLGERSTEVSLDFEVRPLELDPVVDAGVEAGGELEGGAEERDAGVDGG